MARRQGANDPTLSADAGAWAGVRSGREDVLCDGRRQQPRYPGRHPGAGRAGLPAAVPAAQRPGRSFPGQPPLLVEGGAAQRSRVRPGQDQPGPGRVEGGLPPHPLRPHQHPERPAGATVQTRCPHRLSGGDRSAMPVQVSLLRPLSWKQDHPKKIRVTVRADHTAEMKASGMDVLRTDAYPRCFYSRRVYNEVGILQVKLRMLSTSVLADVIQTSRWAT